jgi:two-component system, NarL family, response regulator NreC
VFFPPYADSRRASALGRIRCLLAHDHVLLRQGVRRLLEDEPDFEVVGEACSASEVLEKLHTHRPDVVLLDASLHGFSSAQLISSIQRDYPDTRLIFLGTHPHEDSGELQALPHRCLPKHTAAPHLISILRGGSADRVRTGPFVPANSEQDGRITIRERQILKLVAEGHTARQVADLLGLSVKTVEVHKFNLMRKLQIHNKAQLVTYAIQKRIVKMPVGA